MEILDFKFKWINEAGEEEGFFSKRGSFDGETLQLDDVQIPAAALMDVDARANRMIVSVAMADGQARHLLFAITKGKAEKLKLALGRGRSAAWAKNRKEELAKQGRADEYYEAICPNCTATIDLTGQPRTPQLSCEFCHTISTIDESSAQHKQESQYRLCDECGMYSKPRQFTIFYFYFLLVVYGWRSQQAHRCPACMRPEAWKMLFGNLIFILGVPVAIVQLIRAYGGTDLSKLYPGLDGANVKARAGKLDAAIADYQEILAKQPVAAGVKHNIAHAFLAQNDYESAARMYEFALADCANYQPSAGGLAACYEQLGDKEKLAQLNARWGVDEEQEMLDEMQQ